MSFFILGIVLLLKCNKVLITKPYYLTIRKECGVPVIIEGETGVGKTALVDLLSKLWNESLLREWKKIKDNVIDFLNARLKELDESNKNVS